MTYVLVIFFSLMSHPQPPSWHATREACEAQAVVELTHYELTGRAVAWAACQPVRMPTLRPVDGKIER